MLNFRTALACAAITLATELVPGQVTAETVRGAVSGCETPKTSFRTFDGSNNTMSTTFVDIQGTSVSFTVAGTTRTCLIVEFSAEVAAPNVQQLRVRALLDGVIGGLPAGEVVLKQGGLISNNTIVFSFVGVSPGPHTIKMQYLAEFNGEGGCIGTTTSQRLSTIEAQFQKTGPWIVVIARFLPGLRQVNGLVAGSLAMPWHRFLGAQVVGALLWSSVYCFGPYLFSELFHLRHS